MKKILKKLFESNEKGLWTPGWTSIKTCCQTIGWHYLSGKSDPAWDQQFERLVGQIMLGRPHGITNWKMLIACRIWNYVNKTRSR